MRASTWPARFPPSDDDLGRQHRGPPRPAHGHPGQAADGDDGSRWRLGLRPGVRNRRARDRRLGGGEEAADRARRSADARALEAGTYEVVLEPYAVATLLEYLSFDGFSALAFQEGRSFMELGRRVMGENVTDLGRRPRPERGAVDDRLRGRHEATRRPDQRRCRDRRWSTTRPPRAATGWRRPAMGCRSRTRGADPVEPVHGARLLDREAMTAGMKRGLWVTRFHYVNIRPSARRGS